ncbi:MAG: nucleotidyltransferase family protein [Chitinivibrionales bacterium]
MIGFILAAGFGRRLRPLTDHIPKAAVPLCGRVLLLRSYDLLKMSKVSAIGLNTHYLPGVIQEICKDNMEDPEVFNEDPDILGTGGALYNAVEFLSQDDVFCVVNADIVTNLDLLKYKEVFLESDALCGLVVSAPESRGTVVYEPGTMMYAGIRKSSTPAEGILGADFTGIAFYRREFLDWFTKEDFSVVDVWDRALSEGIHISVMLTDAYWSDTGTPARYAATCFDVIRGIDGIEIPKGYKVDKETNSAYPEGSGRNLNLKNVFSEIPLQDNTHAEYSVILSGKTGGDPAFGIIRSEWGDISTS